MAPIGVIWDVDGTLCDTIPLCCLAFRRVYARHLGRHFTDEEIVAGFGASEAGMIRALVPDAWEAAHAEFLAEYDREHDRLARAFAGIPEVLSALRDRGVRQAVVTGKGPETAAITLGRLGLAPFFDRVETGSPAGPSKPPGLRRILDAWGIDPGSAVYVGDTPYDVAASAEVGLPAVRAAWSPTAGGQDDPAFALAAQAAPICGSPADLLALLTARSAG